MATFDSGGHRDPPTQFLEDLQIGVEGRAGQMEATWEVTAFTEDELVNEYSSGVAFPGVFARPGTETIRAKAPNQYTVEVSLSPSRLGRIQSIAGNRIDDLASAAGIRAQLLRQQASGLGGSFDIPSVTETTVVPIGQTAEGSHEFNFEPMRIPVPEGQSIVDNIPLEAWPTMSFTVRGEADVFGTGSLVFGSGQSTYSIRVPPEAFIEEVEIGGNCEVLHSDLISDIDQLRSNASSALSGAESSLSTLQDIANQIGSEANISTSGGPTTIADRIQNVSAEDLVSLSTSRLRELRTRVEQADDKQAALESARDSIQNLQGRLRDQVGSNCTSEIRELLDEAESIVFDLANVSDDAAALKDALLSALSGIESLDCGSAFPTISRNVNDIENMVGAGGGSPTLTLPLSIDRFESLNERIDNIQSSVQADIPSDNPCRDQFLSRLDNARGALQDVRRQPPDVLGCGDISKGIRDDVSSSVGSVRQYSSKDQLARLPDRKEQLLSDIDEAIEQVEEMVDDENPCKSRLLSRARDARQLLQRTPVRPKTAVPCDQRFSEIGQQLDEFENQVLTLSAPVNPETVQEIAQTGNEIISNIENNIPQDDPCRREMPERVRQLTQRVERLTAQVRVETQVQDSAAQRREELVNQLLSSIDALQAGEETDVETDFSGNIPQT